jgi:hypothetical protein
MASATTDPVLDALERLSSRLERIEGRLDRLDPTLDALDHFVGRLPVAIDGAVGAIAGMVDQAAEHDIDVEQRMEAGLDIAIKATDPRAMVAISTLLGRVDALERMVGRIDKLELLAAVLDNAPVGRMAEKGASAMQSDAFRHLLDSGLADERGLTLLAATGRAVASVRAETLQPLGLFGMLKAMGDPQVQKASALGLAVAKHLGAELDQGTALAKR